MTLRECAMRVSLKVNAVFVDIDRYAADVEVELILQQVIIWQKNLFVHMCHMR